ncbi:MAG: DUF5667 domain-containing protein [Minisyncoccia bacterium]
MNDITKYIKKAADDIRLSEKERAYMSRVVHEYAAMKPLPVARYESVSIEWFSLSWIKQPIAAALALVFIFTGGVSYAAESALPGDALYSVKTNVNESVKVAFATSAEAKANVQIELAERRIAEASALAAEDRLDDAMQESLAAAFESHAESVKSIMEEIDSDDSSAAAEISSSFETRLRAREEILAQIRGTLDESEERLVRSIRNASLAIATIRSRSEEKLAVSDMMESTTDVTFATSMTDATTLSKAMKAASVAEVATMTSPTAELIQPKQTAIQPEATSTAPEDSIDRKAAESMRRAAEKKLKSVEKSARKSDAASADLEAAENLLEDGKRALEDGDAVSAFHSFRMSLETSERASVYLDSAPVLKKAQSWNEKKAAGKLEVKVLKNDDEKRDTEDEDDD